MCSLFPSLFEIAWDKDAVVRSQFNLQNQSWHIRSISRMLQGDSSSELALLMNLLRPIKLNNGMDNFYWRFNTSSVFFVKSFYRFINNGDTLCSFSSCIWNLSTPLKVRIFVWLVIHNKILTVKNLLKKKLQGSPMGCSLRKLNRVYRAPFSLMPIRSESPKTN